MKKTSFVPDGKPRIPKNGDWIQTDVGGFVILSVTLTGLTTEPRQCFRRIEEEVPDPDPQPVAYLYRRTGEERKPIDGEYWEPCSLRSEVYKGKFSEPRHILTRTVLTEGWEERVAREITDAMGNWGNETILNIAAKKLRGL